MLTVAVRSAAVTVAVLESRPETARNVYVPDGRYIAYPPELLANAYAGSPRESKAITSVCEVAPPEPPATEPETPLADERKRGAAVRELGTAR